MWSMTIHVALSHVTTYDYDRPIQLGPQVIRLRPAPHCRSPILSYSLTVEPEQHFINWQQDPFANYQARLVLTKPTQRFKVSVDLLVEMAVYNPFDFFLEPSAKNFPFEYEPDVAQELAPYLVHLPLKSSLKSYFKNLDRSKCRTIDFLVKTNQQLFNDIKYLIRLEPGIQKPEETLENRSGSCRDSAWLLVQLFRMCGLAARFVSGYLIQLVPDVKSLDGPSGTEVDFTDLHAWCEVYLTGAGWIGLDPTSGLLAGEGHIPLACTPTPTSAAPIEGVLEKAEVVFAHNMNVTRMYESARVTQPYTDEQWQSIIECGVQVDQRLLDGDVRLTMGGEPTFVATSDRNAPEWNTDALGPTKRGLATELVHKLRAQYGEGGFLHFGQGKWYPGEQLPRWALGIYWRTDDQACWKNPQIFADETKPQLLSHADALRFTQQLATHLGMPTLYITPGYKDTWYYLWRERRLPVNVDPFDSRLDDEMERVRLRRVFDQGLDHVVGYVLPLSARQDRLGKTVWKTGPWFLRDERMYLTPGDSPMGYRLPLDSLPWVHPDDRVGVVDNDPFAAQTQLPTVANVRIQEMGDQRAEKPNPFDSAHEFTRTALCVEIRSPSRANGAKLEWQSHESKQSQLGVMYVFMPPLQRLEDYLLLLHAIETTAQQLKMTLVLEGYPPPRDVRLQVLQVTPDPGVIEVNIHPAKNWHELVSHTEFLYQAAFETRLSAEKFMTDGRHTGTGGGNHIVMGGITPADSPFLRQPELLASLLLYWHNHPSLSYLFSGLFIGPTSQSPRVDEARNDQIYELEIALKEIKRNRQKYGTDMPPWLVDRTLRNILVDVTGNTHRSEFCIDKLYSPDLATGRLGLLELRSFEMPPHARMSVVQQLLLRALIAKFWNQPYDVPATRWGTELHDRFLLPYYVRMDLDDVLTELGDFGLHIDPAWFDPNFEFRFPNVGQLDVWGIQLELRNALEPWHVMGEEGSSGGTVRYVDSSLERIQVRVRNINPSRHTVTINGRPIPLQSTGTVGEYVAGVRYRAWAPASALHPTIGVHAPLVFDIVDTWMKRSLGGCQYHIVHPGGRSYDTFPVNAYEAESRRLARFFRSSHTAGLLDVPPANSQLIGSREFPFTLDMRR